MYEIEIKKGLTRDFLVFGAELANYQAETAADFIDGNLKKGLFSINYKIPGIKEYSQAHRSPGQFIARGLDVFKCSMLLLAELVSANETFSVFLVGGEKELEVSKNHTSALFLSGTAGVVRFCNADGDVGECRQDWLFDAYFYTLIQYAEKKEVSIIDIPFRICVECKKIFFGRRKDQQFCSKKHGQLWRAREAYRQKKK